MSKIAGSIAGECCFHIRITYILYNLWFAMLESLWPISRLARLLSRVAYQRSMGLSHLFQCINLPLPLSFDGLLDMLEAAGSSGCTMATEPITASTIYGPLNKCYLSLSISQTGFRSNRGIGCVCFTGRKWNSPNLAPHNLFYCSPVQLFDVYL